MAGSTRQSITINAEAAAVMAVIADLPSYPQWAGEIQEVEVQSTHPDGRADRVRFRISAGFISDEHVLAYVWDGDVSARWSLVTSQMLTALNGSYTLAPAAGGGTEVTYELSADTSAPLPDFLKRQAEKTIIERALGGLKARVEG